MRGVSMGFRSTDRPPRQGRSGSGSWGLPLEDPALKRRQLDLRLLLGRALGVAREAVLGDRLPRRRIGDELPELRPYPGVSVDRPQPHPRPGVVVGVTGEDRRAALAAEPLLVPVGWPPGLERGLALNDAERARRHGGVRRRRGSGPPLAACAVAIARAEQRPRDLKAHGTAVAATGQRNRAHSPICTTSPRALSAIAGACPQVRAASDGGRSSPACRGSLP
jgi:hypothetical protein